MVKRKKKVIIYKKMITAESASENIAIQYLVTAGIRVSSSAKNGLFIIDKEESFMSNVGTNEQEVISAGPYIFHLSRTYEVQNADDTINIFNPKLKLPCSISNNNFKRILLAGGIKKGIIQEELYFTDNGWLSSSMINELNTQIQEWNTKANLVLDRYKHHVVQASDLVIGQMYKKPIRVDTHSSNILFDSCIYLGRIKINGIYRYCIYDIKQYEKFDRDTPSINKLEIIARIHAKQWAHSKYNIHKDMFISGRDKDLLEKRSNLRYVRNLSELMTFNSCESMNFNILDTMRARDITIMYNNLSRPWWMLGQQQGLSHIEPFDSKAIILETQARVESSKKK